MWAYASWLLFTSWKQEWSFALELTVEHLLEIEWVLYNHAMMGLMYVFLSIIQFMAETSEGIKWDGMVQWDVGRGWGCRGFCWGWGERKRGNTKSKVFGEVHSLFHWHSPGDATFLLCMIDYVVRRIAGRESGWGCGGWLRVWGEGKGDSLGLVPHAGTSSYL